MKRWLILLLVVGFMPGCADMEDFILGPEPVHYQNFPQNPSCATPVQSVSAAQTAEPDLLRR